jgi:hypothetical protein
VEEGDCIGLELQMVTERTPIGKRGGLQKTSIMNSGEKRSGTKSSFHLAVVYPVI